MIHSTTQRKIFRWIHIIFGLTLIGYIYGPQEEVQQYSPFFQYFFFPVIFLSGFWMWKGHLVGQLLSRITKK